eukprot:4598238-Pyramimonas_sp.AAC.3
MAKFLGRLRRTTLDRTLSQSNSGTAPRAAWASCWVADSGFYERHIVRLYRKCACDHAKYSELCSELYNIVQTCECSRFAPQRVCLFFRSIQTLRPLKVDRLSRERMTKGGEFAAPGGEFAAPGGEFTAPGGERGLRTSGLGRMSLGHAVETRSMFLTAAGALGNQAMQRNSGIRRMECLW